MNDEITVPLSELSLGEIQRYGACWCRKGTEKQVTLTLKDASENLSLALYEYDIAKRRVESLRHVLKKMLLKDETIQLEEKQLTISETKDEKKTFVCEQ